MKIDFKKGIINGVIVYAIVFVVTSILAVLGVGTGFVGQIIGYVVIAVSAYYLAQRAELKDASAALGYGIVTAVVVVVLNYLVIKRFNPEANPLETKMLIDYIIVVVAPIIAIMQKK